MPEIERYQSAAANYLHRPLADPEVIRLAHMAQRIAGQAALDFLRAQRPVEGKNQERDRYTESFAYQRRNSHV